ncbi:MAG: GNAT family N-acetyltransferase [Clostridia bacterium]|nr:GNAT family N-acetyltransferase [Clostridia bacterium]
MKYLKTINLKDGRECTLRNADASDAEAVYDLFNLTHEQTDYLLSYPDENSLSVEGEAEFLKEKTESENEIEILAETDGKCVGFAGINAVGKKFKVRHRAEFGISVDRDFWGLGIGRALMNACIECARAAGYSQIELDAVAENERAVKLYESAGFVEYGRNPKGFRSRITGNWQEMVMMRLELKEQ